MPMVLLMMLVPVAGAYTHTAAVEGPAMTFPSPAKEPPTDVVVLGPVTLTPQMRPFPLAPMSAVPAPSSPM